MNNIFTKTIEIKFSLLTLFILLINVEINAQLAQILLQSEILLPVVKA